jgi:hypothetical protein
MQETCGGRSRLKFSNSVFFFVYDKLRKTFFFASLFCHLYFNEGWYHQLKVRQMQQEMAVIRRQLTCTTVDALKKIGERLQNEVPHHIPSPPSQPRRACVALILRWHSKQTHEKPLTTVDLPKTIDEFFQLPWVKDNVDGRPELLFMQRATRAGDR